MWLLVTKSIVIYFQILIAESYAQVCKKYSWPSDPPAYEVFLPAPPGQRPRCARPGDTFCESLDLYPQYVMQQFFYTYNSTYFKKSYSIPALRKLLTF